MRASFTTESILYWIARGIGSLVRRIPPAFSLRIGATMGGWGYFLFPRRRTIALANLRAAFGSSYTPEEYRQVIQALFQHLGMMLFEVARIPRIDRAYIDRWVMIEPGGLERLNAILSKGKGVIFLAAHFGNWELASIAGALRGYPTLVLAREQGWPRLNALLTHYRESKGCRVVTKGFPIRELIRGLHEGKIVGILSDQDGGSRGVLAPFFGRLSSTAPGAIALSLKTGAPILPVFMVRHHGPAHRLVLGEPLLIPERDSFDARVQAGLAAYLSILERAIRRTPHQWLWFHRRWKSTPERKVVIFSDGKAGHLNQSKALAQRIELAWEIRSQKDRRLEGIRSGVLKVETVPVAFRNRFWRWVTHGVATLSPHRSTQGDFWLRRALTTESYQAIRSRYADISISCGASTAAAHLLWAWGIGAKTIHVTRSRWPSWRRFDLAIIPRHDRVSLSNGNRTQPLLVDGALTPLSRRGDSAEEKRRWSSQLGLTKERQIGLLLGGPTRGMDLAAQDVERVVQRLIEAAERLDAELLVTSSRRTPPAVEEWLRENLAHHPRCRLLVLVNRGEAGRLEATHQAISCILDVAQAVVTSGDSISMVSEALARSKPVVSFLPQSNGGSSPPTKYHRFLREMDSQGKVRWVAPEKVGDVLIHMVESQKTTPPSASAAGADPIVEYLVRWL